MACVMAKDTMKVQINKLFTMVNGLMDKEAAKARLNFLQGTYITPVDSINAY
jgi:hypothetical protein